MLPSVEEMGGKLSEGMGAIEFRLNVVRPMDFRPNDVLSCEDAAIIS